jgi:DNA-binding response OmpR family regulator
VDPGRIARYQELGFDDVLAKPVDGSELCRFVSAAENRLHDGNAWQVAS